MGAPHPLSPAIKFVFRQPRKKEREEKGGEEEEGFQQECGTGTPLQRSFFLSFFLSDFLEW